MNKNWIAGSYYFLNLIQSLHLLQDNQKPSIVILVDAVEKELPVAITSYPYIELKCINQSKQNILKRIINKTYRILSKTPPFSNDFTKDDFDSSFCLLRKKFFDKIPNKISWIPDFQEIYFPNFFSEEQIESKHNINKYLSNNYPKIVLSSTAALNDYNKLFPNSKATPFVVNFAVFHPNIDNLNKADILKKYDIKSAYFFSPNQFWAHKNHIVILKAVKILKEKGLEPLVLFSGKEDDFRNPEYTTNLKKFVNDNNLQNNIKFLGFIDREDQLFLMKHSNAIIQPSLFEGWSTCVEDTKALNQYIILSDIPVHQEQIQENVTFFNPHKELELSNILEKYLINKPNIKVIDYTKNQLVFAEQFIRALNFKL